jgi:hypothetical protein
MAGPTNKSSNNGVPNTLGNYANNTGNVASPFVDATRNQPFVAKTQEHSNAEHNLNEVKLYQQNLLASNPNGVQARIDVAASMPHSRFFQDEIDRFEGLRQFRQAKEFGRQVTSGINESSIASRVNQLRSDPGITGQGFRQAATSSYGDIYSGRESHESQIDHIRGRMTRMAQSDPNNSKLPILGQQLEYHARSVASSDIALAELSRQGKDPRGQHRTINEVMSTINSRDSSSGAGDVAKGMGKDTGAWADLQKTIKDTAEALKGLTKSFEAGEKSEKEYTAAATKLAGEYVKATGIVASGKAEGIDTSGEKKSFFGNLMDDVSGAAWVRAGGQAARATAKVANYSISAMEQKADIGMGFADLANKQFGDQRNAFGGDMASFRRAFGGTYGRAGAEGTLRYDIKQGANVLEGAGVAAEQGANAYGAVLKGDFGGATGNALDGAANLAINTADVAGGYSAGAKYLRGNQQIIGMEDALNMVSDTAGQQAFNTLTGINKATRGLGGDRDYVNAVVGSSAMVRNMANKGIGQDQLTALTGQATEQLGGAFGKDPLMLQKAGSAQLAGLQSAEQFVGNTAQLSNVGGGGGDLESIMASAVAAGMGNAKNINEMVAATREIASKSAGMGINASSGAADLVAKGVQNLGGIPENMRAGVAANTLSSMDDIANDRGLNIFTVQNYSQMKKSFKGAGLIEANRLAHTTPEQARAIARGDAAGIQAAQESGLGDMVMPGGKFSQTAADTLFENVRTNQMKVLTANGTILKTPEQKADVERFNHSGDLKDIHPNTLTALSGAAAERGMNANAELGILSKDGPKAGDIGGKGTGKDQTDVANALAGSQLFDKGLAKFGGQFDAFAATLSKMAATWDVNEKAAAKQAGEFKGFDDSVGKFDGAVTNLIKFLQANGAMGVATAPAEDASKNGAGNAPKPAANPGARQHGEF